MVASVAVLSDIHGVLPALERVLAEPFVADAELIVVTGDHTWGPQPTEVLDRLASLGERALLVRGNADRELLSMARGVDVGLSGDPLSVWGAAWVRIAPGQMGSVVRMRPHVTHDHATRNRSSSRISKTSGSPHVGHSSGCGAGTDMPSAYG